MHETRLRFRIPTGRTLAVQRALAALAQAAAPDAAGASPVPRRRLAPATPRQIRIGRSLVQITLQPVQARADRPRAAEPRLEFLLVHGKAAALVQFARSWVERFALGLDLGTWLPGGEGPGAQSAPGTGRGLKPSMSAQQALQTLVAGVLQQLLPNLAQRLQPPDPTASVAQAQALHQLRVALRRLRCAAWLLGSQAEGWNPAWEAAIRALFVASGMARDQEVLQSSLLPTLRALQAPWVELPAATQPAALAPVLDAPEVGRLVWDLVQFAHAQPATYRPADRPPTAGHPALMDRVAPALKTLRRRVARDVERFADLDDVGVHTLRKRLKRLRYSLEFLAPLLPRHRLRPYLETLQRVQAALGSWHDLVVAEGLYRQQALTDARAWFVVGWVVARKATLRDEAAGHLQRLVRLEKPW
jgi:triphosphatase